MARPSALKSAATWKIESLSGPAFWVAFAAVSFVGLLLSMPETVEKPQDKFSVARISRDYWTVLRNRQFLSSALCIPLLAMPLMGWIALSPVMLIERAGMDVMAYGLWQIPVFCSLIAGNLLLVKFADHWPLGHSIKVGRVPQLLGVLVMVFGALFSSVPHYYLIAGMCLLSLGEGLAFAVLYRFALTASEVGKGAVAACMTMVSLLVYALGVEAVKKAYLLGGFAGFALLSLLFAAMFQVLSLRTVGAAMADRAREPAPQQAT